MNATPEDGKDRNFSNFNIGAQVAWDADLFGRLRRGNEAATAVFLSTEQGRRAVLVAPSRPVGVEHCARYLLRTLAPLGIDLAWDERPQTCPPSQDRPLRRTEASDDTGYDQKCLCEACRPKSRTKDQFKEK